MGDQKEEEMEEQQEDYEEVKATIDVSNPQDGQGVECEIEEPKAKPKAKPKPKAKQKEPVAKPAKNDTVECSDCGKTMSANTLRYKHVCKPARSTEIQKEMPRKVRSESSESEPKRKKKSRKVRSESSDSESEPKQKKKKVSESSDSEPSPRENMMRYYREAKAKQEDNKRAMYRNWFGN